VLEERANLRQEERERETRRRHAQVRASAVLQETPPPFLLNCLTRFVQHVVALEQHRCAPQLQGTRSLHFCNTLMTRAQAYYRGAAGVVCGERAAAAAAHGGG
jgi:hypothetical protein